MSKQTAVEWLIERLLDLDIQFAKKLISLDVHSTTKVYLQEKAKQMEKEQHENTWYAGDEDGAIHEFEYYWEETYGGNK
jgi:hypothetical protein